MFKKLYKVLLAMLTSLSLALTLLYAYNTLELYEETLAWQQNNLFADIHKAPPHLAKNYIPPNEQKLYTRLTNVNLALEEIEADGKVDKEKIDRYWVIYSDAKSTIEKMTENETLPEGTNQQALNQLYAYLETEKAIQNAYTNVNVEGFKVLADTFVSRLDNEVNKIDEYYLDQIKQVSKEYAELEQFSKGILDRLGVTKEDILHVDIQVTRDDTDEILEQISNTQMNRFTHIQKLEDVLKGESWGKILAHNTLSREYYTWKRNQEILDALLHTDYIPVAEFIEYSDVILYDPSLAIPEREGYELITESPVVAVYYQGVELDPNAYVKRGIPLTFDIDYQYTEKEVPEEEIEEPEQGTEQGTEQRPEQRPEQGTEERPEQRPEERPEQRPEQRPEEGNEQQPEENPGQGSNGNGGQEPDAEEAEQPSRPQPKPPKPEDIIGQGDNNGEN